MSRINFRDDIRFRCECDGSVENLGASDFCFEVVEKSERQMGPEIHYSSKLERTCPNCDEIFSVEIEVWEYPEGALNDVEITPTHGKILNKNQKEILAVVVE